MNLLGSLLCHYVPGFVRMRALHELLGETAAAFGQESPSLRGMSPEAVLREYARFTRQHIDEAIQSGSDLGALEERLYRHACRLGMRYGQLLGVRTTADVMAIGRVLYAMLGINFAGTAGGDCVIRECYFSQLYSGPICRVMSAMDRGVFTGLSGGGHLIFTARITEGWSCCRAYFLGVERAR